MGMHFPEEWRELYLAHDGTKIWRTTASPWLCPPCYVWGRLNEVRACWAGFARMTPGAEIIAEQPPGVDTVNADMFSAKRIPVAFSGSSDGVSIDFDAGPTGHSGQLVLLRPGIDLVPKYYAPSLEDVLNRSRLRLQTGRLDISGRDPVTGDFYFPSDLLE